MRSVSARASSAGSTLCRRFRVPGCRGHGSPGRPPVPAGSGWSPWSSPRCPPAACAVRLPIQCGDSWADPLGHDGPHPLLRTYSALLGMLLGTMGLPHVIVRFYTNGCGRAARRTAATVPALLALFYVFPALYG